MKNTILKIEALFIICATLLIMAGAVFAQNVPQIQTTAATNIQNDSATLNAQINYLGNPFITVYFQWGPTTAYENQTSILTQSYIATFSQTVSGLAANAVYHYRVVAQNSYGTVYGQDMTFITGQTGMSAPSVQTTSATQISNFQATLNGSLSNYTTATANYVYFQYGTSTSYGNDTPQQVLGYAPTFTQAIGNLNPGTIYHYRAVARGIYGTVYGQDMTFATSGSSNGYSVIGSLSVTKRAINLSAGNLNWSSSINAGPSDVLSFAITLQASSQDVHNVIIRDILPANLIYKGSLTVNNSNYSGDITAGVNLGTLSAGRPTVVVYQMQVAPAGSFSYGATAITSNSTITSSEVGSQTTSASVLVSKSLVQGASVVSTGLTSNFLTDSFLLPLLIIVAGLWLGFSGQAGLWADKIKVKIKRT